MRAVTVLMPALVFLALVLGGCIRQPSDHAQIDALVRRSVDALDRGDAGAAYRLTDLDFRAVCPRTRYAANLDAFWDVPVPSSVLSVDGISVRGVRGSARVTLDTPSGEAHVDRQFVKDSGRWYLEEDAARCGVAPTGAS